MSNTSSKGIPVQLAGRDFVVKKIPMIRVKRIGKVISALIEDVTKADLNNENAVEIVLDKVLEFPHEILGLFIKDLPKEIFEDEDNGVDFPEFLEVMKVAMELNKIDVLKNFLTRLAPMMIQASTSQKVN